jgi:hypothetical protein
MSVSVYMTIDSWLEDRGYGEKLIIRQREEYNNIKNKRCKTVSWGHALEMVTG